MAGTPEAWLLLQAMAQIQNDQGMIEAPSARPRGGDADRSEDASPATVIAWATPEQVTEPVGKRRERRSSAGGNCLGLDRETRSAHLARRNKPLQSLALDTS